MDGQDGADGFGNGYGGAIACIDKSNPIIIECVIVDNVARGANGGNGGDGGNGVVILSVLDADYSGTTTGSPTVATGVSGKTVLTFTGSGSYTT